MGYLVRYFVGLQPGDMVANNVRKLLLSCKHNPNVVNIINGWSNEEFRDATTLSVCTPWNTANVSCCQIRQDEDFISGPFSGCYMATYDHNNIKYGAHINIGSLDGHIDQRNSWNVAKQYFQNITLCKPSSNYVDIERDPVVSQYGGIVQYWGIISDANFCYTVALQRLNIDGCVVLRFINIQSEQPEAGDTIS